MVAPSVPRLGFEPTICLARPILVEALECFERGDYIGAGVRLRESLKRFLVAAVEWYAVELPERVKRKKRPTPADLVRALQNSSDLGEWDVAALLDCVELGNHAAHCRPISPELLRCGISLLFRFIDAEPYSAMRERQPTIASSDANDCCDDDDDSTDWWKQGGVV